MSANTLFLRLEGPLQAWGNHQSKFLVRRTAEAPTKSGIIGLLCAALGLSRREATENHLEKFARLRMAVRIDRPGVRWWDYHTVGARMKMRTAEGGSKPGAMLTRREYLCDASFLVALQGQPKLIEQLKAGVEKPRWALYLGRKCCVPSRPLLEQEPLGDYPDLLTALKARPWRKRYKEDRHPQTVECLIEWRPTREQQKIPSDALVHYDVPRSFDPPTHAPRIVVRRTLSLGNEGEVRIAEEPVQKLPSPPPRPRADYAKRQYEDQRRERLKADHHLCVFCKMPATTVHHVSYRRAGGGETLEDLRALCRLCHDAVTMIEYGRNMGLDRIDPEDPRWRDEIIRTRQSILDWRNEEHRRRALRGAPPEVKSELLEAEE